jgi:hypothetical protein
LFYDLVFRLPISRFVGAIPRLKLHAQKCFLLRFRPSKAGYLTEASAGIKPEDKLLIVLAKWTQ